MLLHNLWVTGLISVSSVTFHRLFHWFNWFPSNAGQLQSRDTESKPWPWYNFHHAPGSANRLCLIQAAASKATCHHSENVDIGKPTGNAVHVRGALQGVRGQAVTPRSPWCHFLGSQTTASTWHSGMLSIFIQKETVVLEALGDSSSLRSPAFWRETLPLPKQCLRSPMLAEARKHLCWSRRPSGGMPRSREGQWLASSGRKFEMGAVARQEAYEGRCWVSALL